MECSIGAPPSARELLNAHNSGKDIPAPAPVLRPAFNAPGYIGVIKDAQMLVGTDTPPNNSLTFSFSDGEEVDESEFNHSVQSGGVSFSYVPWISFNANASQEEQRSSVSTASDASDITIAITYDDMTLAPINPSASWWVHPQSPVPVRRYQFHGSANSILDRDLGDVRAKYKNLLPGAPKSVQTLVKPTQLLLATRLGYTIKLAANSSKQFDTAYKKTISGGGSFRIFGIPCGIGASGSTTKETNTHNLKWDATKQEITIKPTDNAGFATIVGLIGEKVKTTA